MQMSHHGKGQSSRPAVAQAGARHAFLACSAAFLAFASFKATDRNTHTQCERCAAGKATAAGGLTCSPHLSLTKVLALMVDPEPGAAGLLGAKPLPLPAVLAVWALLDLVAPIKPGQDGWNGEGGGCE